MTELMILAIFIVLLGLLFDYTNGFHDAANVVATVIATKALRPLIAIIMAGIFNIIGATQISAVAQTISSGIVNSEGVNGFVILASLSGAIVWNILTWYFGIPSSSSYALVGGLIGATFQYKGLALIEWRGVLAKVIIPMVISPFAGFLVSFLLLKILNFFQSKQSVKLFQRLQIGSAALVALSHGLNDAQKSMGAITLGLYSLGFVANLAIPFWVIISCALVMGLGTASGGFRIIKTMGFKITDLNPKRGFAAEVGSSSIIIFASLLGMPVSSTHLIAGGVMGAGAARHFSSVNWSLIQRLCWAWILTLPGAAFVSGFIFYIINRLIKL